jgi:hypothetical protein
MHPRPGMARKVIEITLNQTTTAISNVKLVP